MSLLSLIDTLKHFLEILFNRRNMDALMVVAQDTQLSTAKAVNRRRNRIS